MKTGDSNWIYEPTIKTVSKTVLNEGVIVRVVELSDDCIERIADRVVEKLKDDDKCYGCPIWEEAMGEDL